MIAAFRDREGTFHGARLIKERETLVRKGFEPVNVVKSHWETLCGSLFTNMAPSAAITCVECREVLFGPDEED